MATLPHYLFRCYCSSDLLNLFICLISSRFNFGVSGNPALRLGKPGSGVGLGYGLRFKSQFGHFVVDYAINAFQQKTVYFGISNLASWMQQDRRSWRFHTSSVFMSSFLATEHWLSMCTPWHSLLIEFWLLQNVQATAIQVVPLPSSASDYSLTHTKHFFFDSEKEFVCTNIHHPVIEDRLMRIKFLCDLVLRKFVWKDFIWRRGNEVVHFDCTFL